MDEDEDQYGLFVKVTHPDRPTVEIGMTWGAQQPTGLVADTAHELAKTAIGIAKNMEAIND